MFWKEICYRKLNFLLALMGVVAAVTLVVVFITMTKASQNETRRLTRDMGFNLRIVPKETDMNQFWVSGYSNRTMPLEYVNKLVEAKAVEYAHITATLHKKIEWQDTEVILTGISPEELEPKAVKKSKMIFAIPPEKVYLGYELAKALKIETGDKIEVLGDSFVVAKTLSETGSDDDIRIYFDLKTLQKLVNMEGRINEIMALNCMCSTKGDDPLGEIRRVLEGIMPDTKVIMNRTIAVARERQRKMVDNYFQVILPVLLIICVLWIGAMAMQNTMQRQQEIGILRAIGFSTYKISMLFFKRMAFSGFVGAFIGFGLGTWLSLEYGPEVFKVTARAIKPLYGMLWQAVIVAPLFAILASFIPIMYAIGKQPAQILKED
ncbi:FtsX-like permease family protein [Puteibacter caeruleilacunae]|nr:FtsX-like permease family protein [Puteibacter caeruleilacunae]